MSLVRRPLRQDLLLLSTVRQGFRQPRPMQTPSPLPLSLTSRSPIESAFDVGAILLLPFSSVREMQCSRFLLLVPLGERSQTPALTRRQTDESVPTQPGRWGRWS